MTSEAVSNFVKNPTVEGLKNLKKNELLELAAELKLEDVKASLRKPEIARKIAIFYADEGVFKEDDVDQFPSVRKPMSENEAKVKLLELELEKERDRQKAELEKERLRIEAEREARDAERERLEKPNSQADKSQLL